SAPFPVQSELRAAMDDADPTVRAGAFMVLAHWVDKDPSTIEPRTRALADAHAADANSLVRQIVARTVSDDPDVVFEAMFDRAYGVRGRGATNIALHTRMCRHYTADPDAMKERITATCRRDKDWVPGVTGYFTPYVLARYCESFGPSIIPLLLR